MFMEHTVAIDSLLPTAVPTKRRYALVKRGMVMSWQGFRCGPKL